MGVINPNPTAVLYTWQLLQHLQKELVPVKGSNPGSSSAKGWASESEAAGKSVLNDQNGWR